MALPDASAGGGASPAAVHHPPAGEVWRILWANPRSRLGLVVFALFVFLTIFGPWLTPYSPTDTSFALMLPPSAGHLLGTCWAPPSPAPTCSPS